MRRAAGATLTGFVELFNATDETNHVGYVGAVGAAQFGQATAALERLRVQLGFRVDF